MENNHDIYGGKDPVKRFCESLIEYAIEIINFKNKNMMLSTNKQQESYKNERICYICK